MEQIVTPWETFIRLLPLILPLILLQLILMIIALVDISKREKLRWLPKWAWIIIVIIGEMIGPIIYFIFGREE
jgi:hypothetical protein